MHTLPQPGLAPAHPNEILEALSPDDLALLLPNLKEVVLEHGTVLHEPEGIIEHIYFPHSGLISLTLVMNDGTMVETGMVGRDNACGLLAGLGFRRALDRATVQVTGKASRISVPQFYRASQQSNSIRQLVVGYVGVQTAHVQQTAACNALHTLDQRICRWLLLAHDAAKGETLTITQGALAEMLGVRRTSVTHIDCKLQQAGLIRYRRGAVEIIDRSALEAHACECYAAMKRAKMLS
jgi:CRP-like cAMP-binding protein